MSINRGMIVAAAAFWVAMQVGCKTALKETSPNEPKNQSATVRSGTNTQQAQAEERSMPVARTQNTEAADAQAAVKQAANAASTMAIRIDAGATKGWTDKAGNAWLPDTGFVGGDIVDRGSDVQIANTDAPELYRTEHYGMESFSHPLPNGAYTVKLHFAETYGGVAFVGGRVFGMNVEGEDVRNFDVFKEAGEKDNAAVVKTYNVEVTDGKLDILFNTQENNPVINGIEIVPAK